MDSLESSTWSVRQTAAYIGCSQAALRNWIRDQHIPYLRVGRLIRFRKADLDSWLESKVVRPRR